MLKNRILLLFTNHRVAEKLWPILPLLSVNYSIDLFLVGMYSPHTPWVGDIDERETTINKYKSYINEIIIGPGVKFHGDKIRENLENCLDLSKYSLVIYDDNREMSEFNIPQFYSSCNSKGVKVIGNSHGNEDNPHNAIGKSYDIKMDFSNGGIPANDTLSNIKLKQNHILIITNFLGNRYSIFPVNFDKRFVDECGVQEISEEYNLPIKVKLKTRLDDPNYIKNIEYVNSLLKCEVITNTKNIDELIGESALIISSPSTLAFKPIQLGIPTVLIKGSGAIGKFKEYPGLVDLDKQSIFTNFQMQIDNGKFTNYIKNTIAGGENFTSSKVYVQYLNKLINENNI